MDRKAIVNRQMQCFTATSSLSLLSAGCPVASPCLFPAHCFPATIVMIPFAISIYIILHALSVGQHIAKNCESEFYKLTSEDLDNIVYSCPQVVYGSRRDRRTFCYTQWTTTGSLDMASQGLKKDVRTGLQLYMPDSRDQRKVGLV